MITDETLDEAARQLIPRLEPLASYRLTPPADRARTVRRRLERRLALIESDAAALHRRYRATAEAIDALDHMIAELEARR